jgi:hypothetical protein
MKNNMRPATIHDSMRSMIHNGCGGNPTLVNVEIKSFKLHCNKCKQHFEFHDNVYSIGIGSFFSVIVSDVVEVADLTSFESVGYNRSLN